MTDPEREHLLMRAAFEQLKSEDARELPPFSDVLERRAPPARLTFGSPLLRIAAAGVVLAASVATYRAVVAREGRLEVPSDVVSLGAWRPVTDGLLPQTTLISATPGLGASMLDSLTTGALP